MESEEENSNEESQLESQPDLQSIVDTLTSSFIEQGTKKKSKEMSKYLKNTMLFYGNSHPQIYKIHKTLKQSLPYKQLTYNDKFQLSLLLLKQPYFDHKLVSSAILSDLAKKITLKQIDLLKETIIEGTVNNWAICDSLAGKFCKLYSLLSKANTLLIADWRKETNVWLKRMSCVAFVNRIKHKDSKPNFKGFINLMFTICEETIKSKLRFNQLATGWLLRELALVDFDQYYSFYTNNYTHFSREAMRYSIEKLNQTKKKTILCYRPNDDSD